MLDLCRRRGIRVKMTMEHFRSIGELPVRQPWADKPVHLAEDGGPAKSIADFFDGEASRAQFRRKIQWYRERYGDQPVVYGWELWNEINAVRGGDYLAWTEAMLPELEKAFPKNLAMQSLGSFDTERVREAYRKHSRMKGNHLAQVHRYLDLGASLPICRGPVDMLAADAVQELIGYEAGKPVILAESGAVEPRHTGPFKLYKADKDGMLLHDILFAPFFAGSAGCGQTWHWDSYVAANNLWHHFVRFAEAVKDLDPPAENFAPVALEQGRFRIYALSGRSKTLAWIRDGRNNWQSELQFGQPPQTVQNVEVDVRQLSLPRRPVVRIYDPWKNVWMDGALRNGRIVLPELTRSIVIRIESGS